MSPVAFAIKPSASPAGGDQRPKPNVIGPQILLLMKIATPRWIILAIFLCFFFGPIILTLGPDTYTKIFAASPRLKPLIGFESQFTAAGKFIGAVITGIGAFIGFRRLPLRS
jgi:hypothetical protein